jgi:hypothetical protein
MSWFNASSFGIVLPDSTSVRNEVGRIVSDYLLHRFLESRLGPVENAENVVKTHIGEKIAVNSPTDAEDVISGIGRMYPDALVVHIVRDPRDVAISTLFHRYRTATAAEEHNWVTKYVDALARGKSPDPATSLLATNAIREIVVRWRRIVEAFAVKGYKTLGERFNEVRYEDLLQEPAKEIDRLLRFVNLKTGQVIVDHLISETSFNKLSTGRNQGEQDIGSFYRKGIAGDWKSYISDRENRKLIAISNNLMKKYRYV